MILQGREEFKENEKRNIYEKIILYYFSTSVYSKYEG